MLNITPKEIVTNLITAAVTAMAISTFVYLTKSVPNIAWQLISIGSEKIEVQTKNKPSELYVVIRPHRRNNKKQKSIYYEIKWGGYNPKGYVDVSYYKGVVLHLVNISGSGDVVTFKSNGQFIKDLSVFETNEISASPFNHKNIPIELRESILDEASGASLQEKYLFIHF